MLDSATTFDSAHADEDRWVVPDEWWALAVPTRGLGVTPPMEPSVSAIFERAEHLATHRNTVLDILARTAADGATDLAEAGTAAMADSGTCSPLGAAVFSSILELAGGQRFELTDSWVRERGIAFAAEAAALRAGFYIDADYTGRSYNYQVRRYLPHEVGHGDAPHTLARMRGYLAGLPEPEYRSAVAALAALRIMPGGMAIRVATAFLAPTEQDWVAEDLSALTGEGDYYNRRFLLLAASVSASADLTTLATAFHENEFLYGSGRPLFYAALIRFGPECTGVLDRMLRHCELSGDTVSELAQILARFPCDEAFAILASMIDQRSIPSALIEAAHRFPRRASRMLRPAATRSPMVRHILRGIALAHPELAAQLPGGIGYVDAEAASATSGGMRTATTAELPEVLRTPPWQLARAAAKQPTIANLIQPIADGLAWQPGEREEWAQTPVTVYRPYEKDWAGALARGVHQNHGDLMRIIALAPDDLARPYLTTVELDLWRVEPALRRILGRFDTDAIPFVLRAVLSKPMDLAHLLAPITGSTVTLAMIRWLDGKKTRPIALAWLERNHVAAMPVLIATALAKPSKDRRYAEAALRTLVERGHRGAIDTGAAAFDPKVAAAIAATLDADPLYQFPPKLPVTPNWLVPAQLPALVLRESGAALAATAVRDVCHMLAMCGPNGDYAGVAQLITSAEPQSLAEFAWGVLEAWRAADYPAKDGWVLHALGLLGDDETARRLGPIIRVWPGQAAHARAVAALDILTALGTDVALMQLHGIAEKAKFKGLKAKAQEKIVEVAESLELTPEQLADRLVPDFGLNADGTFALDYGPRGFVVGFDEQLKPTVSEAIRGTDGTWQPTVARKVLPKPAAKDDPELAAAAYRAFAGLKKDVKSAAADQIRRFERAMVRGRRWEAAEHRRLFVDHPLLWHLTRRLVWATFDSNGEVTGSFRIAEDRSYADADDNSITVDDHAVVGLAHPLHLPDSLGAWGELFADYEILQPFPQLQRETYAFTAQEGGLSTLPRFQDLVVPTGKVLGLSRFGWERGEVLDGGVSGEYFRVLGDERSAVIDLDPGIIAGEAMEWNEQKITVRLTLTGHEDYWSREPAPVFATLSPITASELLRELTMLVGN